jgi:hypothetical protein
MSVYFIRAGETDNIKIGRAENVTKRLASLQTAHYETLNVLRTIPGGSREELLVHQKFRAFRRKNEWHAFTPEMLTFDPDLLEGSVSPELRMREWATHAKMLAFYDTGASVLDVANAYGYTLRSTQIRLIKARRDAGRSPHHDRKARVAKRNALILEMLEAGVSPASIQKATGFSKAVIRTADAGWAGRQPYERRPAAAGATP